MSATIIQEGPSIVPAYARVPMTFEVRSRLRVEWVDSGLGGIRLVEEAVTPAFTKDYDEDPSEAPLSWPDRFDVSGWGFFVARDGETIVGGAVGISDEPEIRILEGRKDLACLWDVRVAPEWRGKGIGSALLARVADWSHARGCRYLKIETQNNNVAACRFYASRGCRLDGYSVHAYTEFPDEVMMLWYLDLAPGRD